MSTFSSGLLISTFFGMLTRPSSHIKKCQKTNMCVASLTQNYQFLGVFSVIGENTNTICQRLFL